MEKSKSVFKKVGRKSMSILGSIILCMVLLLGVLEFISHGKVTPFLDKNGNALEDANDITVSQLVSDTLAVAKYLRERFGKDKIYLLCHSWGTFIGIQSATANPELFVSSIRDEATKIFELAKEFNLGVEVLGFIQPYAIENYEEKIQITKHKLTNVKHCSLHGPFIDLFPASKDPEIVEIVRKRFLRAYNTAKSISARHLIFHAGYIPKAYFPEDWLKTSIGFWKDFLCDLDGAVEIHIENVCEDDYLLINELIEYVDSPIFSACLDIGHANINSPKSILDWM